MWCRMTRCRAACSPSLSRPYRAAHYQWRNSKSGGKYGDSRLVEVRENSVVLQNAQGRRVLELFPKVSIRKSEAVLRERGTQEKASGQTNLPGQDVGGIK